MSDFLTNLNQHFDSFTHSQKLTSNYLTDHMTEFAFSTLESLAEKIDVSTTTIIRFSRALGYKGFSEMQRDIQAELRLFPVRKIFMFSVCEVLLPWPIIWRLNWEKSKSM